MVEHLIFNISIALALITGTGAGIFAMLTWEILRHSPFGRVIFVLSLVMAIFIIYHVLLLALPDGIILVKIIEALTYTLLLVFIAMMIRVHYRMRQSISESEGEK